MRRALIAFLILCVGAGSQPALGAAESRTLQTPKEFRRAPDNTFLTYPEWFLVHSPAEYAQYVRTHAPSRFPFFSHIGQFWTSYGAVIRATRKYPFNGGYHLMIVVIGASTTVEYAIRGVYERVFGRFTEVTCRSGLTAEDLYGADVAQQYVDFIRVRPWYEFNFMHALGGLWHTPFVGKCELRKQERRYWLSSEYLAKAAYGWLMTKATHAAYGVEKEVTAVVVDRMPSNLTTVPKFTVLRKFDDGSVLATVPRYEAFKIYAAALAGEGVAFREIAGNRNEILVTLLVPTSWTTAHTTLFTQPILTRPGTKRVAVVVGVPELSSLLAEASREKWEVEHVYDY